MVKSAIKEVDVLTAGEEGSLAPSRSQKLLPPPLPRQAKFYIPDESTSLLKIVNGTLSQVFNNTTLDFL